MLPVRTSQMGQGLPDPTSAPDVDPRQWSDAVSRTLMAERVVPGLRIPEAAGYLADLAKARVAALAGKDPEAALREVAAAWTARTKARGTQRQLWHYRRSLNSLATLPQPPERGNDRNVESECGIRRSFRHLPSCHLPPCHLPSCHLSLTLRALEPGRVTSEIPLVVDGTKTR